MTVPESASGLLSRPQRNLIIFGFVTISRRIFSAPRSTPLNLGRQEYRSYFRRLCCAEQFHGALNRDNMIILDTIIGLPFFAKGHPIHLTRLLGQQAHNEELR